MEFSAKKNFEERGREKFYKKLQRNFSLLYNFGKNHISHWYFDIFLRSFVLCVCTQKVIACMLTTYIIFFMCCFCIKKRNILTNLSKFKLFFFTYIKILNDAKEDHLESVYWHSTAQCDFFIFVIVNKLIREMGDNFLKKFHLLTFKKFQYKFWKIFLLP